MTDIPIPKYLYHGTSARAARLAMREGIKPRSEHGKSNWKRTIESNPDTVYLTDAYPLYFAMNASEWHDDVGAVLQIDVEKLNQLFLVPDEDVLEQAGRGHDDVKGGMKQRTRTYRKRLPEYVGSDKWLVSLQAMGTCGSMMPIPAKAITKVAFVNFREAKHLAMAAGDAMICLGNYRFCATKYRNLTNRLFGLPVEVDPLDAEVTLPEDTSGLPDSAVTMLSNISEQRRAYHEAIAADLAKAQIVNLHPATAN